MFDFISVEQQELDFNNKQNRQKLYQQKQKVQVKTFKTL